MLSNFMTTIFLTLIIEPPPPPKYTKSQQRMSLNHTKQTAGYCLKRTIKIYYYY